MNATAFVSQQIVHDRYLYLPLLGILMLIIPLLIKLAGERAVLIAAVVIGSLLSVQTIISQKLSVLAQAMPHRLAPTSYFELLI